MLEAESAMVAYNAHIVDTDHALRNQRDYSNSEKSRE